MLNMAKRTGRQDRNKGDVITLTLEERKEFRALREAKGYTHQEVGRKAGISAATVSNIETGRSKQVNRQGYMAAYLVVAGKSPGFTETTDEIAKDIAKDIAAIPPERWGELRDLVATAKKLLAPR